jgi:hypothetical protein
MEDDPSPRSSRDTRQAFTAALLKPGRGSCTSAAAEADRWSSGGPAEERHGISRPQLLAMALEATRVICAT